MKHTLLLFLLCMCGMLSRAQTDTTFWFAAPEVSIHTSTFDRPIYLRILSYGQAAQVTISQPAGTMPPQVVNVPAGSVQTVDLTAWIDIIENKPPNTTLNYGLLVQSTSVITIYYEVASTQCQCNPEIFVLKGQNALGTDFFIPSQNYLHNNSGYSPQPFSSFDIVATEDITTVTITPSNAVIGHAAGVPYTITLNRGQTYSATAASQMAAQHLQGSRVIADKPVAITVKDDLLDGAPFGGCADLGGDQIIPVPLLGTEYIAMNGFLNGPGDQLFITGTQNGTTVSKNGVLFTTINAGQTYQMAVGGTSAYIQTSAPAYVWQMSGFGCEIGLDVLPSIECTGSFSVGINRTTNEALFMNVLVKNGGQGTFTVNGSAAVITAAMFSAVPGTNGQWYVAQISLPPAQYPVATPIIVNNPTSLFHLGVVHGGPGSGTRFGYFSNFAKFEVNANAQAENVCIGDTVQLLADSIPFATYNWTGPNGFASTQQDPFISNSTLANTGMYVAMASVFDCDSDIDTVMVVVRPIDTSYTTATICPNTSYTLPDNVVVNAAGVYTSRLASQYNCDSVVITTLNIAAVNVSAGADTAICSGGATQLNATGGLIYSWTPANGLSDPNIPNPVATPAATTSYVVSSQVPLSGNAMANGDFSAGNTGFSSSYLYTTQNNNEGQYLVGANARLWNGGMASCGDHTTGNGDMLLVNGATTPNVTVYCQTVNVTPNADYAFSTWLMTLSAGNPAQLQFSINGNLIGSIFTANNSICIWEQFYTTWNAGNNTTATICVVNQNTIASANDFALDDMSFSQLCTATDTVIVTVINPDTTIIDTAICQGNVYTFPGGNTSTVSGNDTAVFTNRFSCDSIIITQLTIKPAVPPSTIFDTICSGTIYTLPGGAVVNASGIYTDSLVAANGCDSIIITNLAVLVTNGATLADTICNGEVHTLPGGGTATTSGIYYDTLTAANGCDSVVATNLYVIEIALTITPNEVLCNGDSTGSITVTATNGIAPYFYVVGIDTNTNGIFSGLPAGNYTVAAEDAFGCSAQQSVLLNEPAALTLADNPSDVSCFGEADGQVAIQTTGGVSPFTYLMNGVTNSTGAFTALDTGSYLCVVTDANNCIDSVNFTIAQPDAIVLNVTPVTDTIYLGEQVQLQASSNFGTNASYLWSPSTGLSCTACANPVVTTYHTTEYRVQLAVNFNNRTCIADSTVSIIVIPEYGLYIPNAFTPNGDLENDFFQLFGKLSNVRSIEAKVFDRTGEKVFEATEVNFKWDGTFKDKFVRPGVFVYVIDVVFLDGHKDLLKGSLTVIR